MIYRQTSAKRIIRRVASTLRPEGNEWLNSAYEWIGEGLELVGAPALTTTKTAHLPVKDHRACMPNDLYILNAVGYSGNPAVKTDGTNLIPLSYSGEYFGRWHASKCQNQYSTADESYTVDPGWLKTSYPEGWVCVNYQAFCTDEEGLPMVPENEQTQQALFWYIARQMTIGGFPHRNKSLNFDKCDQMWGRYRVAAENDAKLPDVPMTDTFMNQWLRFVPDLNTSDSFFATLGDREDFNREAPGRGSIPVSGEYSNES